MSTQDELLKAIKKAVEITQSQVSEIKARQGMMNLKINSIDDQQGVLNDKFDRLDKKVTGLEKRMATKNDLKLLAAKVTGLEKRMATKEDLKLLATKVDIDGILMVQDKIVETVEGRLKRVEGNLGLPPIDL